GGGGGGGGGLGTGGGPRGRAGGARAGAARGVRPPHLGGLGRARPPHAVEDARRRAPDGRAPPGLQGDGVHRSLRRRVRGRHRLPRKAPRPIPATAERRHAAVLSLVDAAEFSNGRLTGWRHAVIFPAHGARPVAPELRVSAEFGRASLWLGSCLPCRVVRRDRFCESEAVMVLNWVSRMFARDLAIDL